MPRTIESQQQAAIPFPISDTSKILVGNWSRFFRLQQHRLVIQNRNSVFIIWTIHITQLLDAPNFTGSYEAGLLLQELLRLSDLFKQEKPNNGAPAVAERVSVGVPQEAVVGKPVGSPYNAPKPRPAEQARTDAIAKGVPVSVPPVHVPPGAEVGKRVDSPHLLYSKTTTRAEQARTDAAPAPVAMGEPVDPKDEVNKKPVVQGIKLEEEEEIKPVGRP